VQGKRPLDRLGQAVDGNHDVLADLAAALRGDRDRDPVAPAPQGRHRGGHGRGVQRTRLLGEHLDQLVPEQAGLFA
jgi:hypothetical protein